MPTAGALDQRITFREYTEVRDDLGGVTQTWADFAAVPTVWASVNPSRGREAFEHDRENATASYKFIVRYRDDVDERHAILWKGVLYNIRSVNIASQRDLYLEIHAERGVGGAG